MFELIKSYLNQSGNKSFYYFLRHYRDEIVATTPVSSRWKDLDNAWSTKFITGAGRFEKVKMQNSSNREMDEDSVNEGPVHDEYIYEHVTKKHRKNKSSSTQQSSRQPSRQPSYDNFEDNNYNNGKQISKLIAENTEIKKYAEVEAENAKLKEIIKQSTRHEAEYEARIRKLEQSDKEKAGLKTKI
ncbi:7828_t:CDS:2 [Entrophospora sp. SA101]|nr:7828_t:CDS:2 [Entrophospora sp. SA101]